MIFYDELKEALEKIIHLDEAVKKRLEHVVVLSNLVKWLKKYIDCDPYNEYCYHVSFSDLIKRLDDWVWFYNEVMSASPARIIDEVSWRFRSSIDYENLKVIEICRKEDFVDCISVDEKLPFSEEAKKKILEKAKEKIEKIVDSLPVEFARLILTITKEILPSIHYEIERLERDYEELERRIKDVIQKW